MVKRASLYLDGELVAESSDFKICQDAENLVRIGRRSSDFGRPVDGWMDRRSANLQSWTKHKRG